MLSFPSEVIAVPSIPAISETITFTAEVLSSMPITDTGGKAPTDSRNPDSTDSPEYPLPPNSSDIHSLNRSFTNSSIFLWLLKFTVRGKISVEGSFLRLRKFLGSLILKP